MLNLKRFRKKKDNCTTNFGGDDMAWRNVKVKGCERLEWLKDVADQCSFFKRMN
jgi:hypothetical protein